ncbi:hypothetical protein V6C32_10940 [Desulforamulus ruminis]|uniref:hypothetical protein n=1 Tax=Desulforamulus ruminis TaxID=1564 RepID=UPI002FDB6375
MEWSKVFNILGLALIVISLYKFAGDALVRFIRIAVALIGVAMLLRNHQEATDVVINISNQWWPVVRNLALTSSQKFANVINSLAN